LPRRATSVAANLRSDFVKLTTRFSRDPRIARKR
jgi:hypothetical protein